MSVLSPDGLTQSELSAVSGRLAASDLPHKTEAEALHHLSLIQSLQRRAKQRARAEASGKKKEREVQRELVEYWDSVVLRNFSGARRDKTVDLVLRSGGIPNDRRSATWLMAIGNGEGITLDMYQRAVEAVALRTQRAREQRAQSLNSTREGGGSGILGGRDGGDASEPVRRTSGPTGVCSSGHRASATSGAKLDQMLSQDFLEASETFRAVEDNSLAHTPTASGIASDADAIFSHSFCDYLGESQECHGLYEEVEAELLSPTTPVPPQRMLSTFSHPSHRRLLCGFGSSSGDSDSGVPSDGQANFEDHSHADSRGGTPGRLDTVSSDPSSLPLHSVVDAKPACTSFFSAILSRSFRLGKRGASRKSAMDSKQSHGREKSSYNSSPIQQWSHLGELIDESTSSVLHPSTEDKVEGGVNDTGQSAFPPPPGDLLTTARMMDERPKSCPEIRASCPIAIMSPSASLGNSGRRNYRDLYEVHSAESLGTMRATPVEVCTRSRHGHSVAGTQSRPGEDAGRSPRSAMCPLCLSKLVGSQVGSTPTASAAKSSLAGSAGSNGGVQVSPSPFASSLRHMAFLSTPESPPCTHSLALDTRSSGPASPNYGLNLGIDALRQPRKRRSESATLGCTPTGDIGLPPISARSDISSNTHFLPSTAGGPVSPPMPLSGVTPEEPHIQPLALLTETTSSQRAEHGSPLIFPRLPGAMPPQRTETMAFSITNWVDQKPSPDREGENIGDGDREADLPSLPQHTREVQGTVDATGSFTQEQLQASPAGCESQGNAVEHGSAPPARAPAAMEEGRGTRGVKELALQSATPVGAEARKFPLLSLCDEPLLRKTDLLLRLFVAHRPEIGYVQGMSYLAAVVLIFVPEVPFAFIAFCNLILSPALGRTTLRASTAASSPVKLPLSSWLPSHFYYFYTFATRDMELYFGCFDEILRCSQPQLAAAFSEVGVTPDMYVTEWWMTLFTRCIPFGAAVRCWDLYLLDNVFLFYLTVSLLVFFFPTSVYQFQFKSLDDVLLQLASVQSRKLVEEEDFFSVVQDVKKVGMGIETMRSIARRWLQPLQCDAAHGARRTPSVVERVSQSAPEHSPQSSEGFAASTTSPLHQSTGPLPEAQMHASGEHGTVSDSTDGIGQPLNGASSYDGGAEASALVSSVEKRPLAHSPLSIRLLRLLSGRKVKQ